jgi:hypothetical protein
MLFLIVFMGFLFVGAVIVFAVYQGAKAGLKNKIMNIESSPEMIEIHRIRKDYQRINLYMDLLCMGECLNHLKNHRWKLALEYLKGVDPFDDGTDDVISESDTPAIEALIRKFLHIPDGFEYVVDDPKNVGDYMKDTYYPVFASQEMLDIMRPIFLVNTVTGQKENNVEPFTLEEVQYMLELLKALGGDSSAAAKSDVKLEKWREHEREYLKRMGQ